MALAKECFWILSVYNRTHVGQNFDAFLNKGCRRHKEQGKLMPDYLYCMVMKSSRPGHKSGTQQIKKKS